MRRRHHSYTTISVALRTEGVDRNDCATVEFWNEAVALRTEGVDRNVYKSDYIDVHHQVALRTEGVDRNASQPRLDRWSERRPPYGGRG